MSDTSQIKPIHSLVADPPGSSLSTQASVGGILNSGQLEPLPSESKNAWFLRIFNFFMKGFFEFSVEDTRDKVLYKNALFPVIGSKFTPTWLGWYLSTIFAYRAKLTLRLIAVSHSAHRGILAVNIHSEPVTTTGMFQNQIRWDISGANRTLDVPIPDYYSSNFKLVAHFNQLPSLVGDYRKVFHFNDICFGYLSVNVDTPLIASSIIPDKIEILVTYALSDIVPYGQIRPRTFYSKDDSLPPRLVLRTEAGEYVLDPSAIF